MKIRKLILVFSFLAFSLLLIARANDTKGEPFSRTSESLDDGAGAYLAPDDDEVSFVTAYTMNYSETDSTSDNEIWVAIVGSTTHVQISDNELQDDDAVLAIAPNGNIIVAWETNYESPEPFISYEFVAYAVLDSEGNVLKPASILDAGGEACVAVTPDGAVFSYGRRCARTTMSAFELWMLMGLSFKLS